MCWSGEASAVLATIGLGTAVYVAKKGESKELYIPLVYFALMELLQAFTYVYIDLCGNLNNQILTLFGYVHIAFQPFFVNMIAMYFIPKEVKEKIFVYVYAVCAVTALMMVVKMYPFANTGACDYGLEVFCGPELCSVSGDWHIAWMMPLNDIWSDPMAYGIANTRGLHGVGYIVGGFLLPFLYGSWRFVTFHLFAGPIISLATTSDPNEYAAVWCLFSIALCVSVIKTPIRAQLHVSIWPFYKQLIGSKKDDDDSLTPSREAT